MRSDSLISVSENKMRFHQSKVRFPLKRLPTDLALLVTEKIPFNTNEACGSEYGYLKFRLSSFYTNQLCKLPHSTPFYSVAAFFVTQENITVWPWGFWRGRNKETLKWEAVAGDFTLSANQLCIIGSVRLENVKEVVAKIRKAKATFKQLKVDELLGLDAVQFVLQNSTATAIEATQAISEDVFSIEEVWKLASIDMRNTGICNENFARLDAVTISVRSNGLTSNGISQFLKQWKIGKRKIKDLYVDFGDERIDLEECAMEVEANLIWNPQYHEFSLISSIPLYTLDLQYRRPNCHYSLCSASNINDILYLSLCGSILNAYSVNREITVFYRIIHSDTQR